MARAATMMRAGHEAAHASNGTRREGGLDPGRGFLPEADPVRALPSAFGVWDQVGHDLPKLLAAGRAREAIARLPVLDAEALPGPYLRRAMLVLSFLGHATVWESWRTQPAESVPRSVAVPWHQVAQRLGRPPVLSYASYALDNWRRLDPSGPIATGNLALLQNFLGGLDEEWFVQVHVEIEALAAPALNAIPHAQAAVALGDPAAVTAALECVATAEERTYATLLRMPEGCDPYIYYHRVRPYIHGFHLHPVVYEGVTAFDGQPQRFYGETGAQSSIVPSLDALLGVQHRRDELRVYLQGMRAYMPPAHRAFVERAEAGPSVRAFVRGPNGRADRALGAAYDACLHWLEAFRSKHLEYAASYIQKQARVGANFNQYGTGGTPFMRYLKKHRDETGRHRVPA